MKTSSKKQPYVFDKKIQFMKPFLLCLFIQDHCRESWLFWAMQIFTCFRLLKPGGAVAVNVLEPSSVPFYQWLNFLKACLHMFGILFHTHHSQRTGQSKTRSFKSLSISTYYFWIPYRRWLLLRESYTHSI